MLPDCHNVSAIGLLNKKKLSFLFIRPVWHANFVLKKKHGFSCLIVHIKQKSCASRLIKQNFHYTTMATNYFSQPPLREKLCKAKTTLLQHLCMRIVFCWIANWLISPFKEKRCIFSFWNILLCQRKIFAAQRSATLPRARILFKRFVFNKTKRWTADSFHAVKTLWQGVSRLNKYKKI